MLISLLIALTAPLFAASPRDDLVAGEAAAVVAPSQVGAQALTPATTWAIVAGVVHWNDPDLPDFSPRHRQDKALFEALGKWGVPAAQRILLLDRAASRERILASIRKQVQAAPPGATFVFFFSGHGLYEERQFILATAETRLDQLDKTGLGLGPLVGAYAGRGRKDRVMLLSDACYSGHLAAAAWSLTSMGVPAAALAAAPDKGTSTENWTFTAVLMDALLGVPFVDGNRDGLVTLGELASELRDVMKHREGQPMGFAAAGIGPDLVLAKTAAWPAPIAKLTARGERFGRGDWVLAQRPRRSERAPARVLGSTRDAAGRVTLALSFYDFSREVLGRRPESEVQPMVFETWPIGTHLKVDDEDLGETEALVVQVRDELHLVRFLADGRDEWIMPDQVLGAWSASDEHPRVEVLSDGDWLGAIVKVERGGEVCVRYPGYDWTEDECVPKANVRPAGP
jgi:hypothetical protein